MTKISYMQQLLTSEVALPNKKLSVSLPMVVMSFLNPFNSMVYF